MVQEVLSELQGVQGVRCAALVAEDGFVVESLRAEGAPEIDFLGAAAASALSSARGLAQELDHGAVEEVMVEYPEGPVLLIPLKNGNLLVMLLDSMSSLGRARLQLKKSIPRLEKDL